MKGLCCNVDEHYDSCMNINVDIIDRHFIFQSISVLSQYSDIQLYINILKFHNSMMNTEEGKKIDKKLLMYVSCLKNGKKMFTKHASHFTIHPM